MKDLSQLVYQALRDGVSEKAVVAILKSLAKDHRNVLQDEKTCDRFDNVYAVAI
jgi:hypothetical protein